MGGSRAGGQGCLTGPTIVFPVGNSMISSVQVGYNVSQQNLLLTKPPAVRSYRVATCSDDKSPVQAAGCVVVVIVTISKHSNI